jgi:hypothetical protein
LTFLSVAGAHARAFVGVPRNGLASCGWIGQHACVLDEEGTARDIQEHAACSTSSVCGGGGVGGGNDVQRRGGGGGAGGGAV